ncbi:MAG: hypothetical protein HY670_06255, partial [Chloroflexi bacterium]|nr:hypothetical protein [Chloroflexota bacterium]
LADGSMLATEIETDEAEDRFNGVVESMSTDQWVVGGRSFKVTVHTRLDPALAVGVKVRVRFVAMTDGTLLATRIQEDRQGTSKEGDFSGNVESISASAWVIGGKTFKLTGATRIDAGLAVGSKARVRFTTLADGSNLASRIEDDQRGKSGKGGSGKPEDKGKSGEGEKPKTEAGEDLKFTGAIESIAADKFVVGGKTFKIDSATMLDSGLVVGAKVKVEFAQNTDGSMTALKIETSKSVLDEDDDEEDDDKSANKGSNKGSGQDNKPGDDKSGKS